MFFNNRTGLFDAIGSREEGNALQLKQMYYAGSDVLVVPGKERLGAVIQNSLERSEAVQ